MPEQERRLTEQNVQQIFLTTGIVLPIGTGICHSCRLEVLKDNPNVVQGRKLPFTHEGSVPEDTHDTDIPLKRARLSETEVTSSAFDDTDSEFQISQETVSQLSQSSEASVSNSLQLESLNKFLSISGISPVKELSIYIKDSSTRTQQRYISKAKQCMELMFSTICPGEENFIKKAVLNDMSTKTMEENAILETLVEIYKRADSWTFQRQILTTIVKDMELQDVQKLIPGLTRYKFNQAKEHIQQFGVGEPVTTKKLSREKYTVSQLDHFIDFITSGQIVKDQPFGEKTLKMETGEVIIIPTVIRSLTPSSIISQYVALCNEENVKPLGNSTLYKILDECSAVVRKSVEGLDNFIMEGCKGFDELDKVIKRLELPTEEVKCLLLGLQKAKTYLKSGLKSHISRESLVMDHCTSYALSSPSEPNYTSECNHQHTKLCEDCESVEFSLNTIKKKAEEYPWQNKEATMYMVDESIIAIRRWKSHDIRSRNQEQARSDIVQQMTNEDALITCDWAMKFLPRKYREGQVDWFAKRGINWHIAVTLLKEGSNFSSLTHVHIFESPVSQDVSITSQILIDVARDILHHKPGLKKINFFSDNAGCYKSSSTILMLHNELSNNIASYNFCEAQNGKGPCDRRASHIKSIIRRYINQGNDVTSALHMKQAVDKEQKPELKVKVASAVLVVDAKSSKCSIPLISKLYNFEYSSIGLRMWKAYAVGEGKMMKWGTIGCPSQTVEIKTVLEWGQTQTRAFETETESTQDDHEVHVEMTPKRQTVFDCPVENCTKQFSNQRAVDDHILLGDCSFDGSERLNVTERAKYIYASKIMQMYPSNKDKLPSVPSNDFNTNHSSYLPMGWALKETKARVTFNAQQKEFMVDKFNIGKVTGNKVDPYVAAEEMRMSGKFKRSEYLSGQQISSYFSRLFQQDKKTSSDDCVAALCEENKEHLKTTIKHILS
ncbi:uncharacterized protein LOC143062512 [Mytilus galloprovincialis]|uniref:uncharacterized protein LOC143062512 n=1 Tax=Mytilus galloprovincialis TaxID=29158 RepID=UPI003F7B57E5